MTLRPARCGVLVLAKAPIPGLAKTRIGRVAGPEVAAELAAAALLDTLDAAEQWAPPGRRILALTGLLHDAVRGVEIARRLRRWTVIGQRGATFADRLVGAHHVAARRLGPALPLVQIGMDTPSLTGFDLDAITAPLLSDAGGCRSADVALGPAADGGWWGLATGRAGYVDGLAAVPMSRPDTGVCTVAALERAGARVQLVHELRDVDEWTDAMAVSRSAPHLRVAGVLRQCAELVQS